jgi:hypothetical protein
MFKAIPQLLIQHLKTLFRDFVWCDVVDADLQVIEPGAIQSSDSITTEEIAIRDECRDHPMTAHMTDNLVEIWMEQRSPPLSVTMPVPKAASRSMGCSTSRVGTGVERSSYSLQ